MKYANIIFQQGDDALESLTILEEHGEKACMRHLAQWDESDCPGLPYAPWGNTDKVYRSANYVLSYNLKLGYVGLCKEVR